MTRRALGLLVLVAIALPSVALALPPVARECSHAFDGTSGPVQVRWASIRRTDGCWFFSGPGELGRDDRLGTTAAWTRTGDQVSLRFGAVRFEGTIAGDRVTLRRVSEHASGRGWRVTETIEGTLTGGACPTLTARYHYDECEIGSASCPGQCHLDAAITLER